MTLTLDDIFFARRVFAWAVGTGRLHFVEYKILLGVVRGEERELVRCRSKERFGSPGLADRVLNRRHIDKRRGLCVYHCTVCNGWHIGNREPLLRKKAAQFRMAKEDAFA